MYKFICNGEEFSLKKITVCGEKGMLSIGDGEYKIEVPEGVRIHMSVIPGDKIEIEEIE